MNSKRIAELNDLFRITLTGGRVVLTHGVGSLPDVAQQRIVDAVRAFSSFTEDNDPYGEHDFGSIQIAGQMFFWKIDYYDRELNGGSPDPSDPSVTTRVLTVMRSDEY